MQNGGLPGWTATRAASACGPGTIAGRRKCPAWCSVWTGRPASPAPGWHSGVERDAERGIRDYLQQRELISYAYFETLQTVTLLDGGQDAGTCEALCYILDRTHPQYAGGLSIEEQAGCISRASGRSGPNADYLHSTCSHLTELGIEDEELQALSRRVKKTSA